MDSRLSNLKAENTAPAEGAFAVTPSDSTDLIALSRAIYVGTGGDISLDMATGETVTFSNVQDGSLLPLRVKRIRSTLTTATNMVAVY